MFSYSPLDALKTEEKLTKIRKAGFNETLSVQNLRKSYGESIVFDNVNLKINKGDKVAITGSNGSGKSRFVMALANLERYDGSVYFDDIELGIIDNQSIKGLLTYLPQESYIFESSVLNNITCFDPNISEEDVYKISMKYGLYEIIKEIGFNSILFDNGSNINSYQKQIICFLRALIKDTPIYIFDEITSTMTKKQESMIIDLIFTSLKDKTIIAIIHNLDMLAKFDKIIYFENKRATDCLSLEELFDVSPEFKKYYLRGCKTDSQMLECSI